MGSNPVESPEFFRCMRQLLKLSRKCEDHLISNTTLHITLLSYDIKTLQYFEQTKRHAAFMNPLCYYEPFWILRELNSANFGFWAVCEGYFHKTLWVSSQVHCELKTKTAFKFPTPIVTSQGFSRQSSDNFADRSTIMKAEKQWF